MIEAVVWLLLAIDLVLWWRVHLLFKALKAQIILNEVLRRWLNELTGGRKDGEQT